MSRVLVVENERIAARDLADILAELGHEVVGMATNFDDARALCLETQPDLALLDIQIDGKRDGISLAAELREDFELAIAFITSRADHTTITQASATRPNGYLIKPFSPSSVDALVSTAIANFAAQRSEIDASILTSSRNDPASGLEESVMVKVVDFIERNMDTTIKIEDLASVAELGPHTFAKKFHVSLGVSPYQFLIGKRVDEAKRMLRNTQWPLSEIALSVGFSNQAHFTTSFKKVVGVTPSAYRRATR